MDDDYGFTEEVCAEFLNGQPLLYNEAAREDPSASIFDSMEAVAVGGEFDRKDSDGVSINEFFGQLVNG